MISDSEGKLELVTTIVAASTEYSMSHSKLKKGKGRKYAEHRGFLNEVHLEFTSRHFKK